MQSRKGGGQCNSAHVDSETEIIGKGKLKRTVFFSPRCRAWVGQYLSKRYDDNSWLFVTTGYGSPRLYVLLRRETCCNHKRVERIYREAGLSLRRKKRKRLVRQRVPMALTLGPNEEWALDFVADALASSRSLRVLTVVDAFTRECLALEADTSLGSLRVVRVLERIIAERGAPRRIRSDNALNASCFFKKEHTSRTNRAAAI